MESRIKETDNYIWVMRAMLFLSGLKKHIPESDRFDIDSIHSFSSLTSKIKKDELNTIVLDMFNNGLLSSYKEHGSEKTQYKISNIN